MASFGGQLLSKMAVLEKAAQEANHRYVTEQKERRELYNKLQVRGSDDGAGFYAVVRC
jgi:hypothetical protein